MDINKKLNQIATHPLQTSYWADFRSQWGNEIIKSKYGLITVNRLPLTNHKIGTFLRGPKPTRGMLNELKNIAKKNNLIFIKLEPNTKKNIKVTKLLANFGCIPGKTLFTPTTFKIDLTRSEEDLLKSFKSKTRYNIRYAARKGITVTEDNSPKALETYLKFTRQTVARQRFFAHTEKYHRLMWKHLHPKIAHLLVAQYQNKPLTTWVLFHWKDALYYPYGAWSGKHQNFQPNSLLMWEAIKLGKKLGAKTFDLWGREKGKGFTRFKEGFNPEVFEFIGTWDLVVNKPLYYLYLVGETARWSILRLRAKLTKPTF